MLLTLQRATIANDIMFDIGARDDHGGGSIYDASQGVDKVI